MCYEPAILNESNDELVSEMIRQLSPYIFIQKTSFDFFSYDQSDCEYDFIIPNIQGNTELTQLYFKVYRCDYGSGNGSLLRSIVVIFQEEKEILKNDVCYEYDGSRSEYVADKEMIKVVMERIGLSAEMINSKACFDEFMIALYCKAVVGIIPIALCERDLFYMDRTSRIKDIEE
ncbi:predicted protein [Naegleria gruberi]|uniref:Predicted protein n=1 Tax=Naegleria gruberi TaxID=5762 RepID=D2W6M8_NAEGR|nr:uncharacterized protein NAEGRDRAFT_55004 [Naegleria gruberi]EFC35274.1 predicted protein [Naegleria gruberi]|eukprot:XP_002668018.1 predicted protein [Naegleria gruberi strain NEG-M]